MSSDDLELSQEEIDAYLEHYGVKGQKWGVRRSRKQLDRANGGMTKFPEKAKHLTDAELADRIKRLETEKRYRELNSKTVSTGRKHVNEVLVTIGKNSATKLGTQAVMFAAKQAVGKKFGQPTKQEFFSKN